MGPMGFPPVFQWARYQIDINIFDGGFRLHVKVWPEDVCQEGLHSAPDSCFLSASIAPGERFFLCVKILEEPTKNIGCPQPQLKKMMDPHLPLDHSIEEVE